MSALPSMFEASRARSWAWWLVPTLLFGLLVGWEIDWGRQVVRVPFAPPPLDPKPVTPLLLPEYAIEGGLVANGETVGRTLFNATRRPAPALAGEGGPNSLKPGQFLLLGTALGGEHNMAFLKEVAGGKSRTVREGDKINGMLVAAVTAERVKLTLGDESEELLLKVAKGPKTTLAPPPPPPVAAVTTAPAAEARAAAAGAPVGRPAGGAAVPARVQQAEAARAARRAERGGAGSQGANQGSGYMQQGQGK
jgi:hypothetical protein